MCEAQKNTPKQAEISAGDAARAAELYAKGRYHWSRGERGAALTAWNEAAILDPTSPAVQAIRMADDILDFFDHNQFNP